MDEIWVPSMFSLRVLQASGKVRVPDTCFPLLKFMAEISDLRVLRPQKRINDLVFHSAYVPCGGIRCQYIDTDRPYRGQHNALQPRHHPTTLSTIWTEGLWCAAEVRPARLASEKADSSGTAG